MLVMLVFSALCGAVAFFKDLHRFKSEIQFSGRRKDLINYLVNQERNNEGEDGEDNADKPY